MRLTNDQNNNVRGLAEPGAALQYHLARLTSGPNAPVDLPQSTHLHAMPGRAPRGDKGAAI